MPSNPRQSKQPRQRPHARIGMLAALFVLAGGAQTLVPGSAAAMDNAGSICASGAPGVYWDPDTGETCETIVVIDTTSSPGCEDADSCLPFAIPGEPSEGSEKGNARDQGKSRSASLRKPKPKPKFTPDQIWECKNLRAIGMIRQPADFRELMRKVEDRERERTRLSTRLKALKDRAANTPDTPHALDQQIEAAEEEVRVFMANSNSLAHMGTLVKAGREDFALKKCAETLKGVKD
jgi:hypothetical protein